VDHRAALDDCVECSHGNKTTNPQAREQLEATALLVWDLTTSHRNDFLYDNLADQLRSVAPAFDAKTATNHAAVMSSDLALVLK
jgi:hypothetical protein